jgi:hypothetical protein
MAEACSIVGQMKREHAQAFDSLISRHRLDELVR